MTKKNNIRQLELLAPVGNHESLAAAVESGADAVYLAGTSFGARAYADNFDRDALESAIKYAHLRNVAVHVTVNTIVGDSELDLCADYLRFLQKAGADAAIIQDLGVAKLAKAVAPNLPLHASTQMTITNLAGVKELAALGFTRVVLSRELSLAEIKNIATNSPIEIEVFVHGALCISYSGQCLMSSLIGGRSGNRGRCAQPCRLPYELIDETGVNVLANKAGEYLLSPRDLKAIDLLPEYQAAGVASLKIEGRMKRPEYVAIVIGTYRHALDRLYRLDGDAGAYRVLPEENRRLAQVFNRDFTTAYLKNRPVRELISDLRPNNRGVLVGRVTNINREKSVISLKLSAAVQKGDELDFWVKVGGRVTLTLNEFSLVKTGRIIAKNVEAAKAKETILLPFPPQAKINIHEHDRAFRVYDACLMAKAKSFFAAKAPLRRILVEARAEFFLGEKPCLHLKTLETEPAFVTVKSDHLIAAAKNRPLTEDFIRQQLNRLGTTVYELADLAVSLDENVMVPASVLNDLRRHATDALDALRLSRWQKGRKNIDANGTHSLPINPAEKNNSQSTKKSRPCQPPAIYVSTDTLEGLKAALNGGAMGILFGGDSYRHANIGQKDYEAAAQLARRHNKAIFFNTPRIVREEHFPALMSLWETWRELKPAAVYVHNIGTLRALRELMGTDTAIRTDFSLISYNQTAISALRDLGVSQVTLSPELNLGDIARLAKASPLPVECIIHGRLEMMVSEYCVLGTFLGHGDKPASPTDSQRPCSLPCRSRHYALKDRKGEIFPLVNDQYCHQHILNGKVLSLLPNVGQLAVLGLSAVRLEAKAMEPKDIARMVRAYSHYLSLARELTAEEANECHRLEGANITRGHFFRGVK